MLDKCYAKIFEICVNSALKDRWERKCKISIFRLKRRWLYLRRNEFPDFTYFVERSNKPGSEKSHNLKNLTHNELNQVWNDNKIKMMMPAVAVHWPPTLKSDDLRANEMPWISIWNENGLACEFVQLTWFYNFPFDLTQKVFAENYLLVPGILERSWWKNRTKNLKDSIKITDF